MGIHYGVPVCESDPITRRMDYFGPMVNRSSRISGTADGGQIMVSADVINEIQLGSQSLDSEAEKDQAGADSADPAISRDLRALRQMGFGIVEVGERKLKGLETPEKLSLVCPKPLLGRIERERATDATIHESSEVFEPGPSHYLVPRDLRALLLICARLGNLFAPDQDRHLHHQNDLKMILQRSVIEDSTDGELLALLQHLVGQVESHCAALQLRRIGNLLRRGSESGEVNEEPSALLQKIKEILEKTGVY